MIIDDARVPYATYLWNWAHSSTYITYLDKFTNTNIYVNNESGSQNLS